ncbi:B-cell receptor CD22 [Ictalurus punctatus]|uniref:B-cell receptor CD22 n=1 Tax=Ictalurus punctatus TaxID=7998 RepID=A0A9F7QSB0_ICTPU|nr:B-cell receptor CD22 [Ictalurus punctatus]
MSQHGVESYDDGILYPPKDVSVTISSSGEIVEGGVVTLSCSSDANPPVETYTWYKVNESSPVGSGQSYSFTLSSRSSGWFYCVAQNKFGNQSAAAVPLTSSERLSLHLFTVLCVAVGVGCCAIGAVVTGLFCMRRQRKQSVTVKHDYVNDGVHVVHGPYITLDPATRSSHDLYSTLTTIRHN